MVVQNYYKTITLSLGMLLGFTTVLGMVLASGRVSAEDTSVVDEINITVPVSCTISGTGMNTHNANINNGLYEDDIGSTTLHAFCNDNEGFAIYAAGYTGNEVGGTNSNKLVGTTASNNAVIESGTATTAGNPDVSNWAMKLTATQDSGDTTGTNAFTIDSAPNVDFPSQAEQSVTQASFSSYHVVPNEYVKVAHKNSGTDMTETTGGVKLTTTYAAYISKTQPADTYSGQVIYTLLHPASEVPNVDISIEGAYARNGKQKYNGYYKMQEMSDSICSIVTLYDEASQTQLIDIRDNKTYYVAKLQDGNCWMTQNLDHDIVTAPNYYTNENTDIGYNSSTQSYDATTWTADYATHTSSDTRWCDESNIYGSCSYTAIASYDPGELYWSGTVDTFETESECTAAGGIWNSTYYRCVFVSSTGNSHYHLGNYYNWNAAVAINDSSSVAEETLVDRSICPAGWTLPRPGTGANSFYNLLDNYGFITSPTLNNQSIWDSPLYFGLSGIITDSVEHDLAGLGYHGTYWTPYLATDTYTPVLVFYPSPPLYPGNWDSVDGGSINLGQSVRCLARPVTNTIEGL